MTDALHSATITRHICLVDDESVIYENTVINGLEGEFPFGHHAVLRLPERNAAMLLSTTPLSFGMTAPYPFGEPANGEYQALAIGAEFNSLSQVLPRFRDESSFDCSSFPARHGFCDLLQIAVPSTSEMPAWSAAVNTEERYLWFSLKDPATLPSTILWMENRGRHSAHWAGRTCCLGVEDVCSFFDAGVDASRKPNAFSLRGIKTANAFRKEDFVVPYIQGACPVPAGFGRVESVSFESRSATFADADGREVKVQVQFDFLRGNPLR